MSQLKLRTQNDCLNCGAIITDRYCSHCSQENIEPGHSFMELAGEAFKEIIDIDSNFYRTLKNIFTRPGLVPQEYSKGKRRSFSNPMRMFFIVGALFVLLLNYFLNVDLIVAEFYRLGLINATDVSLETDKILPLYNFIFGNVSYAIVLTLPLLCLVLVPIAGGGKRSFTDLFVYKVCNYVAYLVLWTSPLILAFFFPALGNYWMILAAVSLLSFYTYTWVSTRNFFGYGWVKAFFMAWLQIILWLVVFALILVVVVVVYNLIFPGTLYS